MTSNLYREKATGALIEVCGSEVLFYRQGGGFVQRIKQDQFYERFEPVTEAPVMRRGWVTAEFLDDPLDEGVRLPCWFDGMLWNGWGMPYFERAQVDELRILMTPQLSWEGDVLLLDHQDGDPAERLEPIVTPDGSQAWGVGAGSWTWDQITLEAP